MKKAGRVLVAATLAATLLLTGCGSAAGGSASTGDKGTMEKVLSEGKLTVGCMLTSEPFGSYDENQKPEGYDVELAQKLADSLGVELEIVDVDSQERISALETGKVDCVIGNFTRTLERAQKVDFSDPYVAAATRIMVSADSDISSVEDLEGKKVTAITGATGYTDAEALSQNIELTGVDTAAEELLAIENGQADAVLDDSTYLEYQAAQNPDKYKVVGEGVSTPFYNCIGVAKHDQEWLNYINLFIFTENASGDNAALYEKYFGAPSALPIQPEY